MFLVVADMSHIIDIIHYIMKMYISKLWVSDVAPHPFYIFQLRVITPNCNCNYFVVSVQGNYRIVQTC